MDRTRISLDNPAFAGRLRQSGRSSAYVMRSARQTGQPVMRNPDGPPVQAPATAAPKPVVDTGPVSRPVLEPLDVSQTPLRGTTAAPNGLEVTPQRVIAKALIRQLRTRAQHQGNLRWYQRAAARLAGMLHRTKQSWALYSMALMIFVIGLIVSLNGLRANRQVAAQVKQLSSESDNGTSPEDNGSKPSTTKPSSASIGSYVVAPNLPRYIDIAKLGVHARVMSMGVTSQNQLKAPGNVYDAGWYNASAQPGQPGGMLIDGHISSWTTKGIFYGINKLVPGDTVAVTRGDGQKFTYTVVKSQLFDADKVDMASLLVSQDTAKPGLNLISCSGDVIPGTNEFNKRQVVYAVMQ